MNPDGDPTTQPLTEESLSQAVEWLASDDPDLARILERLGGPPLWQRPPGFATLVYIILEQQVSLASARAAYTRLQTRLGEITPGGFLALEDAELKAIGFSRQKSAYSRLLAQAILERDIDLERLAGLADEAVRTELMRLKGIGRWTSDIYLMEALLRPDVWPAGDLALAVAVRRVKNLAATPTPVELAELGERWRPWRAVAARMFWHFYLSGSNPFGEEPGAQEK
jgi:DNA-3-methyladenine glycosylase II